MDTISFEKCTQLKRAGLKHPPASNGQFWYDGDKSLYVIHCIEDYFVNGVPDPTKPYVHIVYIGDDHSVICEQQNEHESFHPDVAYLLLKMKGVYLSCIQGDCWGVFKVGSDKMIGFHSESPLEACVEAFLSLNPLPKK
jgi:hypothetical protein